MNQENNTTNNNLFVDNSNSVFVNPNTGMIYVDNINKAYNNNDKNTFNNEDVLMVENKKNNLINGLLGNRKFVLWLFILTFVFTSITVGKTFYLRSKVNDYEIEIDEKLSYETISYIDGEIEYDKVSGGAATELVQCINSSVDINKLPDNIKNIINEINSYYNQSNNHFAFKYKDIYTGFSVSYNQKQNIFTASTIKAPKDIYIYEMASLGKVDLNEKLTYTSRYYNNGSGILKNNKLNTQYDVRTLLRYSTVISDNAAHNMLMDQYGRQNMLEFWKEKGTTAIFTVNNNWGIINANDASIYMEELYRFYMENEEFGLELMNNFFNAQPKFIKGKNGYKVGNKSGWSGSTIHDISIVFADNPYIVVALSNLGNTGYYTSYFNKVNDLAYKLHIEYWKYKMELCNDIDQY